MRFTEIFKFAAGWRNGFNEPRTQRRTQNNKEMVMMKASHTETHRHTDR